mmetsp:Transcript_28793/g.60304  ORF Transcript_28793/g.60304 Transcript_28793/m.60304 type:complete len:140 (-) Transcript_28793:227-646(-)
MWADPGMYVVVNIPSANVNVARNLVRMLQRNERNGRTDLSRRVILVAGGSKLHSDMEKVKHEILRNGSVTVIEARPTLPRYYEAQLPPDTEGKGFDKIHLGPPANRMLLRHVLTNIAYSRFLAGEVATLPVPHLCNQTL